MALTQITPKLARGIKYTYNTVTEMKLADDFTVGNIITTRGYSSVGDGGGANYRIVAAGTGTDDGGSIIDLTATGLQAQLLHNGQIRAEQFGALFGVESSAKIQAAWDALVAWQIEQGGDEVPFTLIHSSYVLIKDSVILNGSTGGVVQRGNIDMANARWDAVAGGNLADDAPIVRVRVHNAKISMPKLYGGKFSACADFFSIVASSIRGNECRHFKGYGYRVRGAAGSAEMSHPVITEYVQADAEFIDRSNFTAKGLWIETGDWVLWGLKSLFSDRPVYIGPDVAQVYLVRPHIVNGNGGKGPAPTNPVIVENHSTNQVRIIGGYMDNGLVLDYGHTLVMKSCHYTSNNRAILSHPYHRIVATAPGQDVNDLQDLYIADYDGVASVGFVDDGANTWADNWSGLSAEYTRMAERDGAVNYQRTQFNIYPKASQEVEFNYTSGQGFQYEWKSGASAMLGRYSPAEAAINYEIFVEGTAVFSIGLGAPILQGMGSPENSVAAPVGSMYRRHDGGVGSTLYIKETGTGNTGWAAK